MKHTLGRTLLGAAALSGALTFGAAGMAGAATPATVTPAQHAALCAKAEARSTRIQTREGKAATWLAAAQARETKATTNHHPKVAKRIARRIARVERLVTRGDTVMSKISAKCGTSAG
jgi:hypothetical protein